MNEKYFSNKVRKALREEGFSVWPIETGTTATGIPDLLVMGNGVVTFIEIKSRPQLTLEGVERVVEKGNLLGAGQKVFGQYFAWGSTKEDESGKEMRHTFVLVSCKEGSVLFKIERTGGLTNLISFYGKEGSFSPNVLAMHIKGQYITKEVKNGK